MTVFFGNKNSDIVSFFLHGWTTDPNLLLENMKEKLDSSIYWVFLGAPIKNNQWFRYGKDNVIKARTNDYIFKLNLNYLYKYELVDCINYIHEQILLYSDKKKFIIMGTSQGATIGFHYLHSSISEHKNFEGAFLHNIAGIYNHLLCTKKTYNYSIIKNCKMNNGDMHSQMDDNYFEHVKNSIKMFKKSRLKNNVHIYVSKNDYVIPWNSSKIMLNELFYIYDRCC